MGREIVTGPPFTITVYDNTVSVAALDEAVALYREIYAEPPYLEGETDFARFASDLPQRARQKNFRLVLARLGTNPLGFGLGHQIPAATNWWNGSLGVASADTQEWPGRTFALIELAVLRETRRHSVGRRLHDHIVAGLTEERLTLLVRPDATAARAAYRKWGYRDVVDLQPFKDGPIYKAMLRAMTY